MLGVQDEASTAESRSRAVRMVVRIMLNFLYVPGARSVRLLRSEGVAAGTVKEDGGFSVPGSAVCSFNKLRQFE